MTATNKPMTGAQLDELMAVAMRMQSDSEKMGERSVSMFAYAVQIAVLEIRETRCKYEELQSQNEELAVQLANAESKCRKLAAENAALKDGVNKAVEDIQCFYDSDGWHASEDGESETAVVALDDAKGSIEHFALSVKTPATDAFLAEVRAQAHKEGAHFVANRMLAAWEAGFIEDTAKNAADIARMILTSTEFMSDAPEGDFDRSFADGVLEDIAAQLRKGAAQ